MRSEMDRTVVSRRVAFVVCCALCAWSLLAVAGLLRENPFRVATDAAVEIGGWSSDQVRFDRGSYGYRFLYSVSAADLAVTTPSGDFCAHVELVHVPFLGWSVRRFDRFDDGPASLQGV